MTLDIEHLPARGRFQAVVESQAAFCDYRLAGGVMQMTHTEVPPPLEGRGIAAELVAAALTHARASGWRVAPICSYVRAYMRRHPETLDLLA